MKQEQLQHLYEIGNEETKKYLETELNYKMPFKVGDFVALKGYKIFGIIIKISGSMFYFDGIDYKGNYAEKDWFTFCGKVQRHPTKEEIEAHLIKVAELKGYKRGVDVATLNCEFTRKLSGAFIYDGIGLISNTDRENIYIWRKSDNKWATIIEPKEWSVVETAHSIHLFRNEDYFGEFTNKELAEKICNFLNSEKE